MSLASACDSPRPLRLGGDPHLVGRLTPYAHGMLLAFLEQLAPGAGIASKDARVALGCTPTGRALLVFAGLYRHRPGLTLGDAAGIAARMDDDEVDALVGLLCASESWGLPDDDDDGGDGGGGPAPRPWYVLERLAAGRLVPLDAIIHSTYDQIRLMAAGGSPEKGRPISHAEVAARVEADRPAAGAGDGRGRGPEAMHPAVREAIRLLDESKGKGGGS